MKRLTSYLLILCFVLTLFSVADATFPTGWGRKCEIVLPCSLIDANLTDYPNYLNEDNFPAEMFSGANASKNDGADIRFSSDFDGTAQLPREKVRFDTTNNTAEFHVKYSRRAATDDTIYVWYDNASATEPAEDSEFGRENVWDSYYKGVWHLNENPDASAPQFNDATSNDNDGTAHASLNYDDTTSVAGGKVGKAIFFPGDFDWPSIGMGDLDVDSAITIEYWSWVNDLTQPQNNRGQQVSKWGSYATILDDTNHVNDKYAALLWAGNTTASTAVRPVIETWEYIAYTYNRSYKIMYKDAASPDSVADTEDITQNNETLNIAGYGGGNYPFRGKLDEIRISRAGRSPAWIKACYKNQNTPELFAVEGTPQDVEEAEPAESTFRRRESRRR